MSISIVRDNTPVQRYRVSGEDVPMLARLLEQIYDTHGKGEPGFVSWKMGPTPRSESHRPYDAERHDVNGLFFHPYDTDEPWEKFPAKLPLVAAAHMAVGWCLHQLDHEREWYPRPDTDGSLHRGWRLHHGDSHSGFFDELLIVPEWQVYGK